MRKPLGGFAIYPFTRSRFRVRCGVRVCPCEGGGLLLWGRAGGVNGADSGGGLRTARHRGGHLPRVVTGPSPTPRLRRQVGAVVRLLSPVCRWRVQVQPLTPDPFQARGGRRGIPSPPHRWVGVRLQPPVDALPPPNTSDPFGRTRTAHRRHPFGSGSSAICAPRAPCPIGRRPNGLGLRTTALACFYLYARKRHVNTIWI